MSAKQPRTLTVEQPPRLSASAGRLPTSSSVAATFSYIASARGIVVPVAHLDVSPGADRAEIWAATGACVACRSLRGHSASPSCATGSSTRASLRATATQVTAHAHAGARRVIVVDRKYAGQG
jgi:hypothetical protein